jgi:hypothetical protein
VSITQIPKDHLDESLRVGLFFLLLAALVVSIVIEIIAVVGQF